MSRVPPVPSSVQQSCTGPRDAWLLPRLEMRLRPVDTPILAPQAKLGGQPVWLASPTWPVSRDLGTPMMFVGQVPIPSEPTSLAYLFVTDDPECLAATYATDSGENALLVQPGGRIPSFIATTNAANGPSLWRRGTTWHEHVGVELAVDLARMDPAAEATLNADIAVQEADRAGVLLDLLEAADAPAPPYSYVGGKAHTWQSELPEIPADWRFHFQLDGAEGVEADLYALNFGGGTGYGFLSPDLREGRFFWDCV